MTDHTAIHDHEADALPQAGRYAICSSKTGPAFPPPADMLARSLQAQAMREAVAVIRAVSRHNADDLVPAWQRLLKVCDVELVPVRVDILGSTATFWEQTLEAVFLALASADDYNAKLRWQNADTLIAHAAKVRAAGLRTQLSDIDDEGCDAHLWAKLDAMAAFVNGVRG